MRANRIGEGDGEELDEKDEEEERDEQDEEAEHTEEVEENESGDDAWDEGAIDREGTDTGVDVSAPAGGLEVKFRVERGVDAMFSH